MIQPTQKIIPEIKEYTIVKKEKWHDFCLLGFESPQLNVNAQPGQFLMVRISSQSHPLLRRPFSIHSIEGNIIEIFFKETGFGTKLLGQKRTGDKIDVFGPLGKGFDLKNIFSNEKIALIGGGRGVAPLYFLASRLKNIADDITLYYGGKTANELPLKKKFIQLGIKTLCSTDDGSCEFKGMVTELLERQISQETPRHIFSCGPNLMMDKIAKIAQHHGIPAQFSLESMMGCGFGVCWGCVKKIKKDNQPTWIKICEEGPVFSCDSIVWNTEER